MKKTTLFVWQYTPGDNRYDNKLILKSMSNELDHNNHYDAEKNARSLAAILSEFTPGNTNDVLFDEIARLIKHCYNNNPSLLNEAYHIQNLIRSAIDNIKGEL